MIRSILAIAVAILAVAVTPTLPAQSKDKPKESPEQKAVRAYLKENLPTGKWEEIRWWPTLPGTAVSPDWSGKVTRLKFRTENQFGGMSVFDRVYTFNAKGKMTVHAEDSPLHANRDRIFECK